MSDAAASAAERQQWYVGPSADIPDNGRVVVEAGDKTIGVFRVDGALVAYENRCAHMGGPVCQGLMVPRVREVMDDQGRMIGSEFDPSEMHIACPWHGYEYNLKTGRHAGRTGIRLRSVPVEENDAGDVYVHV